ncbi:MAG: transcriptional repressor LexA [bacterium]|nr:transcriptional repressor LexA [bacterium]
MNKHFKKIANFYKRHRRMPSYSEIMKSTGIKSKNAVFKVIEKMVTAGLVQKDTTGRIIPLPALFSIRVLGTVTAGWPSPAEEELSDTMNMDEYLIDNRDATYLLKVNGDSMIDAGIMQGDMVLVERGVAPHHGDIVIAEIDHEWTMKYYQKKNGAVWLVPANKKYTPIKAQEELNIAAIVKAVVRKY